MSIEANADGRWLASDGEWYPAHLHPDRTATPPPGPRIHGTPGASAQRVATNWAKGAAGERATAAVLAQLPPGWVVLNDVRMPNSKANIDHVVIGPTGLRVIDTKAYEGTYTYGNDMLWRGRYPLRKEIDKIQWMSETVSRSVGVHAEAVLCFVHATLPRPIQQIHQAQIVQLEALKVLLTTGPHIYSPDDVDQMAARAQNLRGVVGNSSTSTSASRTPPQRRQSGLQAVPTRAPRAASTGRGKKQSVGAVLAEIVLGLIILAVASNVFLGKTTKAPVAPQPRAVPVAAACRHPGTGWSVEFDWPGSAVGLKGYRVTMRLGEASLDLGQWANRSGVHTPIDGLAPGTVVVVDAVAVTTTGNSEIARSTVTVPTTPC